MDVIKRIRMSVYGFVATKNNKFALRSSVPVKTGFAVFLMLILPAVINAEIHTAKSCSVSNVQYAVNAATYGDTVKIPRGNCTWTSGITISKDIHIVGEGADSTILNAGFPDDGVLQAFFTFVPDATARANLSSLSNTNLFEVSGITFAGPSPRLPLKFGVWVYNDYTPSIRRVRIHNNKFISIHRAVQVKGYVHGVFDSNDLIDTNGSYPGGAGLAMFTNDVMTTGSGDGWYIEDNTFSFSSVGIVSGAANHGYGHVVRYNTVTGKLDFYVESHSNQNSYIKGGFFTEVYGNDFSASTRQGGIDMRGGKCIIFSNKMTNASPRVREEWEDSVSGTLPPNMAPSTRPQICTDDNICWKVNHSYFWNNRQSVTNAIVPFFIAYDRYDNVNENYPPELVENREFWNQRPTGTFDGSGRPDYGGGVGCGTLDQMYNIRPTAEGVGFWVTNQSCSNMNGMIGANPATPLEGTLYRNVNGTWTAYYTPYIYPHPIRTSYCDIVQTMYIGYYQRPADPQGMIYWAERLDPSGKNLKEVIEAFADSPEAQMLYGKISLVNILKVINGIYNTFFGRDADLSERYYYINGFIWGRFTQSTIVLDILRGAQDKDLQSLTNKVAAANLFTRMVDPELDGLNFQVTYEGEGDAAISRKFLDSVTWNYSTVPNPYQTKQFMINNIADPDDPILNASQ